MLIAAGNMFDFVSPSAFCRFLFHCAQGAGASVPDKLDLKVAKGLAGDAFDEVNSPLKPTTALSAGF